MPATVFGQRPAQLGRTALRRNSGGGLSGRPCPPPRFASTARASATKRHVPARAEMADQRTAARLPAGVLRHSRADHGGGIVPLSRASSAGSRRCPRRPGRARRDSPLESYQRFFSDFIYTELFIKSFVYAVVTTLLCLLIAYPLALLIARSPKRIATCWCCW